MNPTPDNTPSELSEVQALLEHFVDNLPIKTTEIGWEKVGEDTLDLEQKLERLLLEARIDTANHLHRFEGTDLPKRDYDNSTDEYICTEFVPDLEHQLKDKE